MALSINQKGTIPLTSVAGTTFTAKLQNAGSSNIYPEGTVFDCSAYKTETINATVTIRRSGITFLFGEGDFTMSVANQNMFDIQASNVTIIGTSRSAKDSSSANGSTRFIMTSTGGGYHIVSTPVAGNAWVSSDSMTIANIDLVGVKSVYTSSSGTAVFSTQGSGGIMINEGNPDVSGSNLNNVFINEVLIEGARRHGIMIYGGMASKIQNTRVRNAGGHGFYIAGSTTSTNLDTCYASGCHLAGFSIHNTSYSTLNNCASDSNGLGYWMRNANAVTLSSCGSEACEVRSSIPNNLGITLPSQAGTVTINDIGSDNVNYIKGTSFLFTGGSNITGTSCYSKDPGNRSGETTFASKYTAHIHAENGTEKVNMDNFLTVGDSPVKYKYRLGSVYNIEIDNFIITFDPLNPEETADGAMTPVADVLDAGDQNVFGDSANSTSFTERRYTVADPIENFRINQLQVDNHLSIPIYAAHPANPIAGTIYFNTTSNILYIYSGSSWYNTCCASIPIPPTCIFPNGGVQSVVNDGGGSIQSSYYVNNVVYFTTKSIGGTYPNFHIFWKFDLTTETLTPISTTPISASYHSFSTLAYSGDTNSLYFGGFLGGNADGTGSSHYIYKYNLTTETIDNVLSIENFDETQAADKANFWGYARFTVANGKLFQISTWGPPQAGDNSIKWIARDLETLATLDSGTAVATAPNTIEVLNRSQQGQTFANPINVLDVIYSDNRCVSGSNFKFYTYDLGAETFTSHVYDATLSSTTEYSPMLICPAENPLQFFITNRVTGYIYRIAYLDYSVVETIYTGPGVLNVFEKTVNGQYLLTYVSATLNTQTSLYDLSMTCRNSDGNIIAGPLPLNVSVPYNELINANVIHALYDSTNTNYFYDILQAKVIKKLCSPYVD